MSTEVIRKVRTDTDYLTGKAFEYDKRKKFLLYLFPLWLVDVNADVWVGTYEKRKNG